MPSVLQAASFGEIVWTPQCLRRAYLLPSNYLTMRPADAYRLKYRSSSRNSMETETNETAEARVVDELRALELDDIARAARERDRRAAHMRLPPPHKLVAKVQYFGPRGESGRRRIVCLRPVELRAFVHEQQRRIQGVLRAAAKADPRSPGAGAQGTREDVERRPRLRVWSAKRRRLERPLVLAVLLQDQNPEQ